MSICRIRTSWPGWYAAAVIAGAIAATAASGHGAFLEGRVHPAGPAGSIPSSSVSRQAPDLPAAVSQPSGQSLEQGFVDPPVWAKPRVYWWWLFNRVDKAAITRDLEQFKAKGISGVNLICTGGYAGRTPLFGVKFLGPEWRELFRHAVKEASRLGIEMGFNLAGGWVMIGPWVTKDNAMKKVVQAEVVVTGPRRFSGPLPEPEILDGYYKDVWIQAYPARAGVVDPKDIIDLTNRLRPDGQFDWDVPAGDWRILRTGYTLTGNRWNPYPLGDTSIESAGYQIDYLNAAALDDHFAHIGTLALDEAARAGGKLGYLWSDSWECGKLTWTQDFPAQFRRFRGYDLEPYMPALSGHSVINADVTARFLADFDRTIEDCIAENFYGHFAELCHRNGVRMGDEAAGPGDIPPMDSLRNLGRCDIPAGEFWVNDLYKFPHECNLNLKQTAAAAHTYGKKQAMAESFTQQEPEKTHWYFGPGELKPFGDGAFCEGINAIMLHCAVCQPPSDGKPGYEFCAGQHWDPNITWWDQTPAFFTYLARCQFMLQEGLFASDVCFYLGEEPPVIAPPKHDEPALGPGFDYDYCNAEVLLTRMAVKGGRIVLPDGVSYRLLVLQNCTSTSPEIAAEIGEILSLKVSSVPSRAMSVEVAKKIREMVRDGATVVGPKPDHASGLRDYPRCDVEVRAITDEVWGDCDGKTRTEHRFGKGRVVWGKSPREILAVDGIGPDFAFSGQDEEPHALDFIHRSLGDTDVYFVVNRQDRGAARECSFRVSGRRPEIWDPVSGARWDAAVFTQSAKTTTVPLEFAARQSFFIVFRKPAAGLRGQAGSRGPRETAGSRAASTMSNFPKLAPLQTVAGPWTVTFDPSWGGPASAEFPELISWPLRPENGIKFYSGKATYKREFDVSDSIFQTSRAGRRHRTNGEPGPRPRLYLDLGRAKDVAVVRLNGRELGVLWTPPWRVGLTDVLKPAGNVLEIDVINLWANRVIGDLNLPLEKRLAKTHDAFRFDMLTKNTPLRESGLFGPVVILGDERRR